MTYSPRSPQQEPDRSSALERFAATCRRWWHASVDSVSHRLGLGSHSPHTSQSSASGATALQTVSLEEHSGFAGMAMPTLPTTGRKTFYGRVAVVAGIVIVAFFVTLLGISGIQNVRDQAALRTDFAYALANATAPVSALGADEKVLVPGTPMAIIQIPRLGVDAVVVEGTTSDVTMHGPGHRRDTVLPGQVGVSVIYGREFAYGGAFNQLGSLRKGDQFTVITGQGEQKYKVIGIRHTGDELPSAPAETESRLTLVSASGMPLLPFSVVRVDATLTSQTVATPLTTFPNSALADKEEALRGNSDAWPLFVLSLIYLLVLIVVFMFLRRYWGKWQTWIVAVPVLASAGYFVATQIATLFPNLV